MSEVLFVVGGFWSAGGFSSHGIARWVDFCLPETVPYRDLPHTSVGGLCLELAGDTLDLIGFGDSGQRSVTISITEPDNGRWGAKWDAPNPIPDGAVVLTTARGVVGGSSGQLVRTIEAKGVARAEDDVLLRFAIPGTSRYFYQTTLFGTVGAAVSSTLDTVLAMPLSGSNPMVDSLLFAVETNSNLPILEVHWQDTITIRLAGGINATANGISVRPVAPPGELQSVREISIAATGVDRLRLKNEGIGAGLAEEPVWGSPGMGPGPPYWPWGPSGPIPPRRGRRCTSASRWAGA